MKTLSKQIKTVFSIDGLLIGSFILSMSLAVGLFVMTLQSKVKVPTQTQTEFKKYVRSFLIASKNYTLPIEFEDRVNMLSVKFGNPKRISPNFVGYCDIATVSVIVDKAAWDNYEEGTRQSLIDHELGHCLLERNHRHAFETDGTNKSPISIMFPSVLPHKYYVNNRKALLDELFSYSRYNKLVTTRQLIQVNYETLRSQFETEEEYIAHVDNHVNGDKEVAIEQKAAQVVFNESEAINITVPSKKTVEGSK